MNEKNKMHEMTDEFQLIEEISSPFQSYRDVIVPNGDDAAIYRPTANMGQIVCVDTMVESIHFARQTMSPYHIGHKSLAANISDIAAMGGIPAYFLISLSVSKQWSLEELKEMYQGMKSLADQYQIDLLGGDTVSNPHQLVIGVTALGEVEEGVNLLRSNASPGDVVFVTGHLGNSAAGLDLLLNYADKRDNADSHPEYEELIQAHQMPYPHVKQGRILAHLAKQERISLNDVSDGMASEAYEIAQSSRGVDLVINKESLPVSNRLLAYANEVGQDPYYFALNGGEDFVLTGTMSTASFEKAKVLYSDQGLHIYAVGYVQEGNGAVWLEHNRITKKLSKTGYNHFRV